MDDLSETGNYKTVNSTKIYHLIVIGEEHVHVSCKKLFPILLCNLHNKTCSNQII